MENVTHLLINIFSNTKEYKIFSQKKKKTFYVDTNKTLKCKDAPYGVF